MSEPIKVGDWVQVVRACCDAAFKEVCGAPWTVSEMYPRHSRCPHCGLDIVTIHAWTYTPNRSDSEGIPVNGAPVSWLKRIPPLSELESEQEHIHEPA